MGWLWAFEQNMGRMDWMEWRGYPLDCYDYESTCVAKKDGLPRHAPWFCRKIWSARADDSCMASYSASGDFLSNSEYSQGWGHFKPIGMLLRERSFQFSGLLAAGPSTFQPEYLQRFTSLTRKKRKRTTFTHTLRVWSFVRNMKCVTQVQQGYIKSCCISILIKTSQML